MADRDEWVQVLARHVVNAQRRENGEDELRWPFAAGKGPRIVGQARAVAEAMADLFSDVAALAGERLRASGELSPGPTTRWTVADDGDSHRYLVPVGRLAEFEAACEASARFWSADHMPDNAGERAPPDPGGFEWAHLVEGGTLTFALPEYDGEPVR